MHFSKTYAQLLLTLPPEFRNNAFEYRKDGLAHVEEHPDGTLIVDSESVSGTSHRQTIVYEIVWNSSVLQPRLRLSSSSLSGVPTHCNSTSTIQPVYHVNLPIPERSLSHITRALLHTPIIFGDEMSLINHSMEFDQSDDLIIPLPSDMAFFQLLTSTLSSLSGHLNTLEQGFNPVLTTLAASISSTARPASSSAPRSFSPYSLAADHSMSLCPGPGGKSDLCTWREIFRLYVEAEVFESVSESTRGERSIEGVEKHLELFKEHVQEKKEFLVFPRSREAFDVFLNLNLFILNVKKFQLANSEATRKILKKHAKRTTLPIPSCLLERDASTPMASSCQLALITRPSKSLPRLLVQAIGEVLLPIIPHIDDYSCLICASIAFKPIRLCCGHFFCVRCLVKMQRRRMADCPMCRAQTVLQANPSNVDYGLLNLMADWFPIESREKQHANEREVVQEQLEALGITDARICRIM
ncbi:hypothetical protein EV363DRAFT_1340689, partial [Boletus edulis]